MANTRGEEGFLDVAVTAKGLRAPAGTGGDPDPEEPPPAPEPQPVPIPRPDGEEPARTATLRIRGTVPPELWNRLGTKLIPKLRSGEDLTVGIELSVKVSVAMADGTESELKQILDDLNLAGRVEISKA